MAPTACTIDGCDRTAVAHGWCTLHYKRWRRHGSPTAAVNRRVPNGATLEERLAEAYGVRPSRISTLVRGLARTEPTRRVA